MLLGAYVLDEVVRNIVEALRSACRVFNEGLYPLAISNAYFASKAAVILLCDYAFKRNLIGKPPMSHRGRQYALTLLCSMGLVSRSVVEAYSEIQGLRSKGVYAFRNGENARRAIQLSCRLVKEVFGVLGVRVDVEECKRI